eukprot:1177544-Prorocentrum_minimum.AAC.4
MWGSGCSSTRGRYVEHRTFYGTCEFRYQICTENKVHSAMTAGGERDPAGDRDSRRRDTFVTLFTLRAPRVLRNRHAGRLLPAVRRSPAAGAERDHAPGARRHRPVQ